MVAENKMLFNLPHQPIYGPAGEPQDKSGDSVDYPYLGVWTAETTQRYVLGTRYITWDGRVYKYSYAIAAVLSSQGCKRAQGQACNWSALASTSEVGSYEVNITVGASEPGTSAYGTTSSIFLKDKLAGGYVALFDPGTGVSSTRGIVGNDGRSGTGTLKLYIDSPIHIKLTSVDAAEVMTSPYYNLMYKNSESGSAVAGIATLAAQAEDYFWAQTWGPCFVTSAPNHGKVNTEHFMHGIFRADGAVGGHDDSNAVGGTLTNRHQQHAGFCLGTKWNKLQAAPFTMLQISI